jgi:hypothetical protein
MRGGIMVDCSLDGSCVRGCRTTLSMVSEAIRTLVPGDDSILAQRMTIDFVSSISVAGSTLLVP